MKRGLIHGVLALFLVCALAAIPALAAEQSDPATVYYNAAERALVSGDYATAIAGYDQALASNTTMIRLSDGLLYTYRDKAYAQIQLGNYSGAVVTLNAGIAEYPKDQMLWNNLGYSQYKLGSYADAVTSYDRALAIDGNYTTALINKGDAQLALGDSTGAVKTYKAALESDPGNSAATEKLAAAEKAAGSALPVTLIVVVIVVIAAAAGVAYYATKKNAGAGKNADGKPDKKSDAKKNTK